MKKPILLLVVCVLAILSEAGNTKTISLKDPKEVVITGQVINKHSYDPNTIAVIIKDIASFDRIQLTSNLDEAGNFELRFKRYYAQEILLKYDFFWNVFIHPGDSIHIVLDAKKMESDKDQYRALTFTGDAANENEQLSIFNEWFGPIRKNEPMMQTFGYSPEAYKQYRDSLRTAYHNDANRFIETQKITEPIKSWIYYEIEDNYYSNLSTYPVAHPKLKKLPSNWDVPISYYNYLAESDFNSDIILNSNFSQTIISIFSGFVINNLKHELMPKGLIQDTIFPDGRTVQRWKVENIDSVFIDGINRFSPVGIKQFILYNHFGNKLKRKTGIDVYEKYLSLINKEITEPFLVSSLQKYYNANKNGEKMHAETAGINNLETQKNVGTELLNRIVSANTGKVIYFVFWKTSCGVSLSELPMVKTLMSDLNSENIEFVFLCCNSPEEQARPKVAELKLGGTHYFMNVDETNHIQNALQFTSYPSYFVMNKKGQFLSSNSGFRPAYIETKEKLKELIND